MNASSLCILLSSYFMLTVIQSICPLFTNSSVEFFFHTVVSKVIAFIFMYFSHGK